MAGTLAILEVGALDLGGKIKAVGLELLDILNHEPLAGGTAPHVWAGLFPALAAGEFLALDFFSHLNRVREFCTARGVAFRQDSARCLVIPQPLPEQTASLLERFMLETLGIRVGAASREGDAPLEEELSRRGLDAYQDAYARYTYCAVCEPGDGWVTLLSERLSLSEMIRRLRNPAEQLGVQVRSIS